MSKGSRGLYVSRIKYRIRNQHADMVFPRLAILLGPNGSGKTSAINAIQLGLMGAATEVGLWPSVKQPARLQSLLNNGQPGTVSAVVELSNGETSQWGMTVTPEENGKLKAKVTKPKQPVSDDTFIVQWLESVLAKESAMAVLLPRIASRQPAPEWLADEVAAAQAEGAPDLEGMNTLGKLYALRDRLTRKRQTGVAVVQEAAQEQLEKDIALPPVPMGGGLPVATGGGLPYVPGSVFPTAIPTPDPWQPLRVFLLTGAAGPEVPADIVQWLHSSYDGLYQRIQELERQAFQVTTIAGILEAQVQGGPNVLNLGPISLPNNLVDLLQCAGAAFVQRDWLGATVTALGEGRPVDMEWAPPLPPECSAAIRTIAEKLLAYQQISSAYPALWAAFQAIVEYQKWLAQAVGYSEAYFPIQQAFNQILRDARNKAGLHD